MYFVMIEKKSVAADITNVLVIVSNDGLPNRKACVNTE